MLKQRGISLLEVLAAIFVVSIGLLGVLAVIPFGVFQISKAQHAEYASNMLANAAEEIRIRDMINPTTWNSPTASMDPSKFMWIEPQKVNELFNHISCVGADFMPPSDRWNLPGNAPENWVSPPLGKPWLPPDMWWKELMSGQDDLVYSLYDDKRPDFVNQANKIQSSGKYTWFFTYQPLPDDNGNVVVDVLACHNRVPENDRQVLIANDNGDTHRYSLSRGGSRFTLPDENHLELLSQTKYVFVTWGSDVQVAGGTWCRIVFLDKSDPGNPQLVVTGSGLRELRSLLDVEDILDVQDIQIWIYIPSGVLYHKRVPDVPI